MEIWYFHGQYKADGLRTNKISYNIFDLRHVSKVASHFPKKTKCSNDHSRIQTKKVGNHKKLGCRAVFRTLSNICDGAFCENITPKSY